jgi:hypothetical protein
MNIQYVICNIKLISYILRVFLNAGMSLRVHWTKSSSTSFESWLMFKLKGSFSR